MAKIVVVVKILLTGLFQLENNSKSKCLSAVGTDQFDSIDGKEVRSRFEFFSKRFATLTEPSKKCSESDALRRALSNGVI